MPWTVFIDGGARGNPGPAAAGIHIVDPAGRITFSGGLFLGRKTNNEAEYAGLLFALDLLAAVKADDVLVRSDSELLVRQLQGQYRVKAANLRPLYDQAVATIRRFAACEFQHVPREENKQADKLVNEALDAVEDVIAADPQGLYAALRPAKHRSPQAAQAESVGAKQTAGPPVNATPASEASTKAAPTGAGGVTVAVIKAPRSGACPAGTKVGQTFLFTSTAPTDAMCVEACASVIYAVLSLQSADSSASAGDSEPLTVTCGRPGCGAVFQLRPA
ncbi:MAG TPA: TIGR04076 family protein [Phycisphaerae bacterium]|nr:TIGR04076 family protein [Phycisphaerae bacterium]HPU27184.1 TIGR04076 family protein [Phycisphaerae bacterium]